MCSAARGAGVADAPGSAFRSEWKASPLPSSSFASDDFRMAVRSVADRSLVGVTEGSSLRTALGRSKSAKHTFDKQMACPLSRDMAVSPAPALMELWAVLLPGFGDVSFWLSHLRVTAYTSRQRCRRELEAFCPRPTRQVGRAWRWGDRADLFFFGGSSAIWTSAGAGKGGIGTWSSV